MHAVKRFVLLTTLAAGAGFAVFANAGSYKVTDLSETFPQAFGGFKINNADQLMRAAAGDGVSLPNTYTFIYGNGVMTRIETPLSVAAQGASINDLGDVTGTMDDPTGNSHVFQYRGGIFTDLHAALGSLAGYRSCGAGINNAGQVAGYTTYHTSLGFVVSQGNATGLDGTGSEATISGINNLGQITGTYRSSYGSFHAFLYSNGSKIDLGSFTPTTTFDPNNSSTGVSVNDAGQVVGSAKVKDVGEHAFLYQSAAMADMGTLGGANSYPMQINNAGVVVGKANIENSIDFHAFVYSDGTMTDLNSLIDASDPLVATIVLTDATGINGQGAIVATGKDQRAGGVDRYYLCNHNLCGNERTEPAFLATLVEAII